MSCQGNGIQCGTIQVLEPDSSVPVADAGGTADPSLVERGDYVLAQGETEVQIFFKTRKAAALYRFEYLYVDTADVSPVQPHPGQSPASRLSRQWMVSLWSWPVLPS